MKYVLSLSFGKDSMAMLIEILKRKLPLDYIIFCVIMFNKDISGEHPLMAEWIPQAEQRIKVLLKEYGYDKVEIIHLTGKKNFVEQFYTTTKKGKYIGTNYGFPYLKAPWCNSELKMKPISDFIKKLLKVGPVTEYIGIAKDEKERLERYQELETENHKYITLADLDITELDAMDICKQNNLLSPKYTNSFRGGCWFCNNQTLADLYLLWRDYPDYFAKLEELESTSHNKFRCDRKPLCIRRLEFENGQVPKTPIRKKKTTAKIKKRSLV